MTDLPNEILLQIFGKMSFRELCRLEQSNRRFRSLIKSIWLSIDGLTFNKQTLFGTRDNINTTGHCASSTSFDIKQFESKYICKIFKTLLCKKLDSRSLKHLDLSEYAPELRFKAAECLKLIGQLCPNLVSLNLSEFQTEKKRFLCSRFVHFTKQCNKLVEINLSNCPISDAKVECLFINCKSLRIINLSYCQQLVGKCFEKSSDSLQELTISKCYSIREKYLLHLFVNSPNIQVLCAKDLSDYSSGQQQNFVIKSMVANLSQSLTRLEMTIYNSVFIDQLASCLALTKLDVSGSSFVDCKKLGILCNKLESLTYLDLSHSKNLDDSLFTQFKIKSPLQHLDLTCLKELTDSTLLALIDNSTHLKTSLKRLEIVGCDKLTGPCILRLIGSMKNLEYLNMSDIHNVDNSFLIELYSNPVFVSQINCYIYCHFIDLDVDKFLHYTTSLNNNGQLVCSRKLDAIYELRFKHFIIECDV